MLWGASLKSFEGPACAQGYLWSNAIRVGYPGLSWNWLDSSRRFSPLWFSLIFYSILGFTRYNMDLRTSIYGVAWGNKTRSWFLAASLTRRLLLLNGTVCFFARSLKFGLWEWYSKIDLMWSIFYMYIGTPQKIFAQGPISVQFSCSVMSNSLQPHGLQHACPSLSPRVCSNSHSLSRWCYSTISSSVIPFSSCLQSFPDSGSFPMSQFFALGS